MAARDPQYAGGVEERPDLDRHFQSSVKGLFVVGAANGSPLLKTCINEGVQAVRHLARTMPPGKPGRAASSDSPVEIDGSVEIDGPLEIAIVGAGPAGLSAALEARKRGYRLQIFEQGRPLNTILNFPAGKHVYAEPTSLPTLGVMDLDDASKEELLAQWDPHVQELDIVRGVNIREIRKDGDLFELRDQDDRTYRACRVILSIGRMGNPRKLDVPGEDLPCVYTALLNPGKYSDQDILVIGGGNSAAEAAIALAPHNRVTMIYRGESFARVSRANLGLLDQAKQSRQLKTLFGSGVTAFRSGEADVQTPDGPQTLQRDVAFVLIGADPPTSFLKRIGVRFEGQFGGWLLAKLAWVFALVYSIYGIKFGLWPLRGVYTSLKAANVDPGLLYGIGYTVLVTFFGARAMRKYRDDPYQTKRYSVLIACQVLVYFLLPWALYYAHYAQWWRTWGVSLTYPLGYYGLWAPAAELFSQGVWPWTIATLLAFVVVMPIVSAYHGKRFCAWVCPCGGMADTVGDGFRQKAPRGQTIRKLELSSTVILIATLLCSVYLISGYRAFQDPTQVSGTYKTIVDVGLASLVAITLYPFAGSRIWCRFFCPLAKWMEWWGRWTGGKLAIVPNDECISCGECTRYCQMGIDVRAFAQREQPLSNKTTCCIFCGICVTVCPVDVLRVESNPQGH